MALFHTGAEHDVFELAVWKRGATLFFGVVLKPFLGSTLRRKRRATGMLL